MRVRVRTIVASTSALLVAGAFPALVWAEDTVSGGGHNPGVNVTVNVQPPTVNVAVTPPNITVQATAVPVVVAGVQATPVPVIAVVPPPLAPAEAAPAPVEPPIDVAGVQAPARAVPLILPRTGNPEAVNETPAGNGSVLLALLGAAGLLGGLLVRRGLARLR